jgi:cyclin C
MKPSTSMTGKVAPVPFLASLNVPMPLVLEVIQDIVALYSLWQSLEEPEPATESSSSSSKPGKSKDSGPDERVVAIFKRMHAARKADIG